MRTRAIWSTDVPLYEYECENGHRFEVIQKFSDPPLERCSRCGAPVQKLQSAPAFQFKGSGWYITDYARKDQAKGPDAKAKPAAESGSTDSSKGSEKETAAAGAGSGSKDAAKPAESAPASGNVKTE